MDFPSPHTSPKGRPDTLGGLTELINKEDSRPVVFTALPSSAPSVETHSQSAQPSENGTEKTDMKRGSSGSEAKPSPKVAAKVSVSEPPPTPKVYDRYGFDIATGGSKFRGQRDPSQRENISLDATPRAVARKLNERLIKWQAMISDWDGFCKKYPKKVKSRIRKGIPDPLRGMVWKTILGSDELMNRNKFVYQELQERANGTFEEQINRDITRTFPTNEFFKERDNMGERALHNVVRAYSLYDDTVGYCQGMNFIVGILLFYMLDEEAFWAFVQIMHRSGMANVFRKDFPRLKLQTYILERLIEDHLPKLHKILVQEGIKTEFFCTQWFMTLYAYNWPFELVLRIWDIFLFEGPKILYRVALGVLKLMMKDMSKLQTDDLMMYLQNIPIELLVDTEAVLNSGFSINLKSRAIMKYEIAYYRQEEVKPLSPLPILPCHNDEEWADPRSAAHEWQKKKGAIEKHDKSKKNKGLITPNPSINVNE